MTESQVGRPVSRVDGVAKVTGAARYAADAEVRGVTHAVLVMSTVARGRVTAIDTAGASAAPGVLGVFTHQNLARLALPSPAVAFLKRFLPVQDDLIRHAGQPVAIVVADTLERAQQASGLVGVSYRAEPPRVVLADDMGEAYIPPEPTTGPTTMYAGTWPPVWPPRTRGRDHVHHADASTTTPSNRTRHGGRLGRRPADGARIHARASPSTRRTRSCRLSGSPGRTYASCRPYLGGGFGCEGPGVAAHRAHGGGRARRSGGPSSWC